MTLHHTCEVQRRRGESHVGFAERAQVARSRCPRCHGLQLGNRMTERQLELARRLRADPRWREFDLRTVRRRRQPGEPRDIAELETLPPLDDMWSGWSLVVWLHRQRPAWLMMVSDAEGWCCTTQFPDGAPLIGRGCTPSEAVADCVVAVLEAGS